MRKTEKRRGRKAGLSARLFRLRAPLVTALALAVGGALIGVSYWYSSSRLTSGSLPCPEDEPSAVTEATVEPTKGCLDAPVTIVEFSEFYCPFCARFVWETLPKIVEEYVKKDLVKLVFRNFPVHGEPAIQAALAGECAHEQGRFWEYHDRLFTATSKEYRQLDATALVNLAGELGLDRAAFRECLSSGRYRANLEEDIAEGKRLGVRGTPTFFINGQMVVGAQPFEKFKQVIEEELKRSGR
ncbi:MAG: DsbA family protein [Candidatus Acetothermia bacterium]|nr:DsbA family protein [Candidatus Acetothermia bacterium]MDH7505481.1 DsbA family protein [Candidatus Acetothermia bacterium]